MSEPGEAYAPKTPSSAVTNNRLGMVKAASGVPRPSVTPMAGAGKQGMNASFSQMNNSMSAKWDAIKKAKASDSGVEAATGEGRGSVTPMNNSGNKFNRSNRASDEVVVKASNQDLNNKLAQMKAKFQAYKKQE